MNETRMKKKPVIAETRMKKIKEKEGSRYY